jgi:hypothetical protein
VVIRFVRKFFGSSFADWIIRVGIIASIVVSGYSAFQLQEASACQARYDDANNDRSRALMEPLAKERKAERAELKSNATVFLDPALLKPADERTPEEVARIRQEYLAWRTALADVEPAQQKADAARAANPILPPISEFCG